MSTDYADTSAYSFHVDDDWYRELASYAETFRADWEPTSADLLAEASAFAFREARLLDTGDFEAWLECFAADGVYWVPSVHGGGDPTREISWAFDDVRRLTDRVYWLRTGMASCQIPPSRTRRVLGNVEVLDDAGRGLRFVRSNVLISEFRAGVTRLYAADCAHVLRRTDTGWRIRMKRVNLIDSDQGHENMTLML
jgi:benzoate/toluate 1,2-dioxygenase beta subunit